jgi:hypothetical protein
MQRAEILEIIADPKRDLDELPPRLAASVARLDELIDEILFVGCEETEA